MHTVQRVLGARAPAVGSGGGSGGATSVQMQPGQAKSVRQWQPQAIAAPSSKQQKQRVLGSRAMLVRVCFVR